MEPVTTRTILRIRRDGAHNADDVVVREEPLEIRLGWLDGDVRRRSSLSVTMRTPGDDVDLALGFLFTESIVHAMEDVTQAVHCGGQGEPTNIVRVELADGVAVDTARLQRHFYTSSSCGVCGKTSLEAVAVAGIRPLPEGPRLRADVVHALPERLGRAQTVFTATGGLHAAALFDEDGVLLLAREDVGRHNAVDKLAGATLRAGHHGRFARILFVSGRASFELVQKALVVGWPVLAAVGAPSSLAIELAESHGMTLLGFVRDGGFNVYTGARRLVVGASTPHLQRSASPTP